MVGDVVEGHDPDDCPEEIELARRGCDRLTGKVEGREGAMSEDVAVHSLGVAPVPDRDSERVDVPDVRRSGVRKVDLGEAVMVEDESVLDAVLACEVAGDPPAVVDAARSGVHSTGAVDGLVLAVEEDESVAHPRLIDVAADDASQIVEMDRSSESRSGKLQRVEAPGWLAKKSLHHPIGGGPASDDLPQVVEAKGRCLRSAGHVERRVVLTRSRVVSPGESQPVGL